MTFDDLLDEIQEDLVDQNARFWSRDYLKRVLNEAQRELAAHVKCLIARAPITRVIGSSAYLLPSDLREIKRIESEDGVEIPRESALVLQKQHKASFRDFNSTSDKPACYYTELSPSSQIEFYPRPDPSVEASLVEITYGNHRAIPVSLGSTNIVGIQARRDRLHVVTTDVIYLFSINDNIDRFNLISSYTHGETWGASVPMQVIDNPGVTWNSNLKEGDLFIANGQRLIRFTFDGVTWSKSDFKGAVGATIHGFVHTLDPDASANETRFVYQGTDQKFYWTSSTSYSEQATNDTVYELHTQSAYNENSNNAYFACGTDGIISFNVKTDTLTVITSGITEAKGIASVNDSTVYFTDDEGADWYLHKINTSDNVVTKLTETKKAVYWWLFDDGQGGLWDMYEPSANEGFPARSGIIRKYNLSTDLPKHTYLAFGNNVALSAQFLFGPVQFSYWAVCSLRAIFARFNTPEYLFVTDKESGVVGYIDDIRPNQESGNVTGIVSSDIDRFYGPEGTIESIESDAAAYYIIYIRNPVDDVLEAWDHSGIQALKHWVMSRAYQIKGSRRDYDLSLFYLNEYTRFSSFATAIQERGKTSRHVGALINYH